MDLFRPDRDLACRMEIQSIGTRQGRNPCQEVKSLRFNADARMRYGLITRSSSTDEPQSLRGDLRHLGAWRKGSSVLPGPLRGQRRAASTVQLPSIQPTPHADNLSSHVGPCGDTLGSGKRLLNRRSEVQILPGTPKNRGGITSPTSTRKRCYLCCYEIQREP